MNERDNKPLNVADGLAWSYYFGYLKMVLPILGDKIGQSKFKYNIKEQKLFILLPKTCYTYDKIEDADKRIKCVGNLDPYETHRGGIWKRSYQHTVHKIKMPFPNGSPDGEIDEPHLVLEYATPLMTLYDMSQYTECGLSRKERDQQVELFIHKLTEILEGSKECKNKYKLVPISGEENKIADVLVEMLHDADKGTEAEGN